MLKKRATVKKISLLVLAAFFLFFSNGRWCFALAGWLSPMFLLRYTRKEKPLKVFFVTSVMIAVCYQIIFLKFSSSDPSSILFYLPALLGPVIGSLYVLDSIIYRQQKNFLSTLVFPVSYVILEYIVTLANPLGNTGILAYSQYQILPIMQLAAVTGTYGITFLIIWFGSFLNYAYDHIDRFTEIKRYCIIYALIMATVLSWGSVRLILPSHNEGTVRIAGIHVYDLRGQEGQDIWSAATEDWQQFRIRSDGIQDELFDATAKEAQAGAKIIVWSEVSPPITKEDEQKLLKRAQSIAKSQGIYLVINPYIDHQPNGEIDENKLYIINDSGEIVLEHYKYGGNIIEGTVKGNGILQTVDTPYGRLSGVICWDQDFPQVMRQAGQNDVDILLAPTADWKEIDPLHSMVGVTRAIENGYSLFRQDMNGLSIAVDAMGRTISQMDHYISSDWTMTAQVPIKGKQTLYSVFGDWFVYVCFVILAGILVKHFSLKRMKS